MYVDNNSGNPIVCSGQIYVYWNADRNLGKSLIKNLIRRNSRPKLEQKISETICSPVRPSEIFQRRPNMHHIVVRTTLILWTMQLYGFFAEYKTNPVED